MSIRSNSFFSRPQAAALVLAVSFLGIGVSSAKAQWFNFDSALPPMQVERMIQASGYRLTGPVIRNGEVYLANVLGRYNDSERLVIDASTGRLLQRYRAAPTPRQDWASLPRPQAAMSGNWFDRDDDAVAPRPPNPIYGDALGAPLHAPPAAAHAPTVNQVAHADDSSSPFIIPAPSQVPAANPATLEKPRLRPQVRHKKPEPTPVAQPATTPNQAKPAPIAQPATTPNDGKPASVAQPAPVPGAGAPTHSDAAAPAVATPRVAATKPAPAPMPTAAPAAPPPKAPVSKQLNDVPVAPLE